MSTPTGTAVPRWQPQSEADILQMIEQDGVEETHHFDAKRLVGDTPSARKETARDLASFALHGGVLLVGLAEDKEQRTWSAAPQPLDGLPERIESLAASAIDPPLFVVCRALPSAADPASGFVVVEVPPSPVAPHMVDGVYYGRGDKTRVRLSDSEVLAHHQQRAGVEARIEAMLDAEVARDPVEHAVFRHGGRIYGVAQPLTSPKHLARTLVRADTTAPVHELVMGADRHVPGSLRAAHPPLGLLSYWSRRANGRGWSSYAASGDGRRLATEGDQSADQRGLLDVEVREDGGVRLLVGRLTEPSRTYDGDLVQIIFDGLLVAYAIRLVVWAAAVAEATGYRGSWQFGVHCTELRGHRAHRDHFGSQTSPFDEEHYREVTTATHLELTEMPGAVVERLVGRFTWTLGSDEEHAGTFAALNKQPPTA